MFSTRNLLLLASAGFLSLGAGCQRVPSPQPDRLNDAPLLVDEAMQIRTWDRSTAYYASGNTVAGHTRVTFEPSDDNALNYVVDPSIGLGNFVIIPFTYFWDLPFSKVDYQGAIVPPSHYAMPPAAVVR